MPRKPRASKTAQVTKPEPRPRTAAECHRDLLAELEYGFRRLALEQGQAYCLVTTFAQKVAADPVYQLGWAEQAFDATGRLKARGSLLHYLLDALPSYQPGARSAWRTALAQARREALRLGRNQEHSTSTSSNRLERAVLAAWADLAEEHGSLEWLARAEEKLEALETAHPDAVAFAALARVA